jgi:hypothetical protein
MPTIESVTFAHGLLRMLALPFLAAVAIIAFVASPIIKFCSPEGLLVCGFTFAVGIFLITIGLLLNDKADYSKTSKLGFATALGGFVGMIVVFMFAMTAAQRTDFQCGLLERDMLSLKPSRSDAHDLYAALQCRQQSVGTLMYAAGGKFK